MELIKLKDGHSRLKITVTLQNKTGHEVDIDCLIDTGCKTTMLDIRLAAQYGEKLLETATVNLTNRQYIAQAYRIHRLLIGGLELKNVFVFAAQYDIANELYSGMLLGLNVLNNLRYCVDRNENTISIKENIFSGVPDKSYPYSHWFDVKSNEYVQLQH